MDVLGTETYVASARRGLTVGIWCYVEGTGSLEYIISKWGSGDSWRLVKNASDYFTGRVYDGSDGMTAQITTFSADTWYLYVLRFLAGTSQEIFVSGVWAASSDTAVASINNGASDLTVGGSHGGSNLLTGRVAYPFMCAAYLSNVQIQAIYDQTRSLFGV